MSGENNPLRQLAAAWEAATAVVTEWAEQTAAITSEAFHKLSSDPAIRAVLESWRTTLVWGQRDCECVCARSHPDDMGICDKRAVITRRLPTDLGGDVDVPLCAPCAVAQGVAEMPRLPCMGLWPGAAVRDIAAKAAVSETGRMRPSGLAEIEAARADGRWTAAYEPQRNATAPPDLAAALSPT